MLRTEFDDGDGAWEVIDFAPRVPDGLSMDSPIEIIRFLQTLRGRPKIRVTLDPQPDYARRRPQLIPNGAGVKVLNDSKPRSSKFWLETPFNRHQR